MTTSFPLADAQVHATLASIAYAGDTLNGAEPTLDALHAAINHQLNCTPQYPTKTDWTLVWGPVETAFTDNLVFAAFDRATRTLAFVIRGTTGQTLSRFEDVPRYQAPFPALKGPAMVSGPFLGGLHRMLDTQDKWQGKRMKEFYDSFNAAIPLNAVTVTGHSQGAALVPMLMVALQEGLLGAPKPACPVKGFAFAPPTSGNAAFAAHVDATCDCWFIINPKDVVPLGYDAMSDVVTKGIPETLTFPERQEVEVLIDALNLYVRPDHWAQPKQQALLEGVTLEGQGFFAQIGAQHNHNAYMTKLGVPGTSVGDPSVFPVSNPPVVTIPPQGVMV